MLLQVLSLCCMFLVTRAALSRITSSRSFSGLTLRGGFSKDFVGARSSVLGMSLTGSEESVGRGSQAPSPGEETGAEPLASQVLCWTERIKTSIAKSRKIKGGNYVQLATVEMDDAATPQPKVRTVVFRGFLPLESSLPASLGLSADSAPLALKMITDARSSKCSHIAANRRAELVWWFSQSSEQYRVTGDLVLVDAASQPFLTAERTNMWKQLSDPAREQFYWQEPGRCFSGAPTVPPGGRDEKGDILPPPDAFLLLLLIPRSVHFLRLRDNYAQGSTWDKAASAAGGAWVSARLNP